jgi:DNA-directed RNA polymerase subunit L
MSEFSKTFSAKDGYKMECEFKNFPVTFVNGLRRILIGGLPRVVISDIEIIENTSQMPHEMLEHRVRMLPVNVQPTDSEMIKNVKIELMAKNDDDNSAFITTNHFTVQSGRDNVLMKDRDWDTPVLVMKLQKGDRVRLTGKLTVQKENVSHVCTATSSWKVDPELAKLHKEKYVNDGGNPKVFDNFYIQKSYYKDDAGRPSWLILNLESIGVIPCGELLKMAIAELTERVKSWIKLARDNISRESELNVYSISLQEGDHTIGALLQEIMYYRMEDVKFGSYDVPHPLLPTLVLRFLTESKPEDVLSQLEEKVYDYCKIVESGL